MVRSGTKFKKSRLSLARICSSAPCPRKVKNRRSQPRSRDCLLAHRDRAFSNRRCVEKSSQYARTQKTIDRAACRTAQTTAPKDAAFPITRRPCKIWESPAGHASKNPVLRNEPIGKPGPTITIARIVKSHGCRENSQHRREDCTAKPQRPFRQLDPLDQNYLTALIAITACRSVRLQCRLLVLAPCENIARLEPRHQVPYRMGKPGHIILTDGDTIDYEFVNAQIIEI